MAATISLYRDGERIGDYLALNISSGGALLANGPALDPGSRVQTIVRLHGACSVQVDALTVRAANASDRDGKIAITFQNLEPDREDMIHSALLDALEKNAEPSILIVHRSVTMLGQLAESVAALGRRPVLAYTPLDAILSLCDPDTKIDAALIDTDLRESQGVTLLRFLKDEYPTVQRIVVHGEPSGGELENLLAAMDAQAVLRVPASPSRVRELILLSQTLARADHDRRESPYAT